MGPPGTWFVPVVEMPALYILNVPKPGEDFQQGLSEWNENKTGPISRQLDRRVVSVIFRVGVFNFSFLCSVFSRRAVLLQAPPARRASKHSRFLSAGLAIKQSWGVLRAGHGLCTHHCFEIWLRREAFAGFLVGPQVWSFPLCLALKKGKRLFAQIAWLKIANEISFAVTLCSLQSCSVRRHLLRSQL